MEHRRHVQGPERHPLLALLALPALAILTACSNPVGTANGCQSNSDCDEGQFCLNQECLDVDETPSGCTNDNQCAPGQTCNTLTGACDSAPPQTQCMSTSQCTDINTYCNSTTSVCTALLDGWCRNPSQCPTETPICSAPEDGSTPGSCVECLVDTDCAEPGARCINPGVCAAGPPQPSPQPSPGPEAPSPEVPSPVVPAPTPNPDPGPSVPDDVCATNGWYGDGTCDTFCPMPDPDCDSTPGPTPSPTPQPTPNPSPNPTPNPTPNPAPGGQSCTFNFDCWGIHPNYTCDFFTETCGCDASYVQFFYCNAGQTVDANCDCVGGPAENEPCVTESGTVVECADGLICVTVPDANGDPSYGTCKQRCQDDTECPGRTCALGFLGDGAGVCGNPLSEGDTGCDFWTRSDNFCHDPSTGGQGEAFIDCLSGTCGYICDYDGNTDGAWTCPDARTCGPATETHTGFNVDVGTCQAAP